jgi:hypothetical protein
MIMQEHTKALKQYIALTRDGAGLPKPKEWGSYEDACKILDRSKAWYRKARGEWAYLVKGEDWKAIGNEITYKLESIERLKTQITK